MNVFFLHTLPWQAAEWHCDQHVTSQIKESVQIMSACHANWNTWQTGMTRPTHRGHPCVKWAGESPANYYWLHLLAAFLLDEFENRHDRTHAYEVKLSLLAKPPRPLLKIRSGLTAPALAMPDAYKQPIIVLEDAAEAYRRYYIWEKASFARYEHGPVPYWLSYEKGESK